MPTLCAPLPEEGTRKPRSDRRRNLWTLAPAGSRRTWHGGGAGEGEDSTSSSPAPPPPPSPPARSSTSPSGSNALVGDLACASLTTAGVDATSAKQSLTTSERWRGCASSRVASVVAALFRLLALEEEDEEQWLVHALGGRGRECVDGAAAASAARTPPPPAEDEAEEATATRPHAAAAPVPVASTTARTRPGGLLVGGRGLTGEGLQGRAESCVSEGFERGERRREREGSLSYVSRFCAIGALSELKERNKKEKPRLSPGAVSLPASPSWGS